MFTRTFSTLSSLANFLTNFPCHDVDSSGSACKKYRSSSRCLSHSLNASDVRDVFNPPDSPHDSLINNVGFGPFNNILHFVCTHSPLRSSGLHSGLAAVHQVEYVTRTHPVPLSRRLCQGQHSQRECHRSHYSSAELKTQRYFGQPKKRCTTQGCRQTYAAP